MNGDSGRSLARLKRGPDELATQKLGHQRPDEIREIGLIAIRFGGSEAMIAKIEIMPFQGLPIGIETLHHALLDRKRAVIVMAAVKNHRRAFDFPRGITRMARTDARRWLIGDRRIIGDKGPCRRRRGDEVDAQPPTHAVTDDSNT